MPEQNKEDGWFKKKITIDDLQKDMKVFRDTMLEFSKVSDKKFEAINGRIDQLSGSITALVEMKNIPNEWLRTIEQMREIDPTLPETSQIYSVLLAYKNLSSNLAKRVQQKTIQKLSDQKREIAARNIHNCGKCGAPVEEGDYYEFAGKKFCLKHKDEPLSEQQKESLL